MFKRILCVFCSVVMIFSMISPAVYADDEIMNHEHNWVDVPVSLKGEVFGMEYQVSIKHCTICNLYDHTISLAGYSYEYFAMTAAPGVEGVIQNLAIKLYCSIFGENATATKFTPGGGSTSGSGVGRPKGYADDNGTASVNNEGNLTFVAKYCFTNDRYHFVDSFSITDTDKDANKIWHFGSSSIRVESYSENVSDIYAYGGYVLDTQNISGIFYIPKGTTFVYNPWGEYNYHDIGFGWNSFETDSIWSHSCDGSKQYLILYRYNNQTKMPAYMYSNENGTDILFYQDSHLRCRYFDGVSSGYPDDLIVYCRPTSVTVNKQTTITINNNTWNGNIYTDNSTNLTYIYPQYTTVNEKNETVTNISTTPIIYNNETKQYYTYDQTTKNYYYITYNTQPTPSPSPTPAPTEKPGGSISTPETGKPGGDTGDTTGILAVLVEIRDNMIQGFLDIKAAFVAGFAELSANFTLAIENLTLNIQNFFFKGMSGSPVDPNIPGGGSGTISTPETGGKDNNTSSGWSWNPLKWLSDLLKDIVEGIIKAIWKLITALFGFLLWLLSLVGSLFPFIPGQAVLAVTSAVVIVAVIRIIKFITGR